MTVDFDKQEPSVRRVLRSCSAENRKVARMWLYYTLFYWMFPTIAVIFGLLLAKRPIRWTDLVIHGEFLIYAITMVAGSTRLIAKDVPNKGPFVARQGFNLAAQVMIFPAMVAYGLVRYISSASNGDSVSVSIVVGYSIVLLAAAFVFSYMVFLIDAQRSTPQELPRRAATAIARAPEQINSDFNILQKKDPTAAPVLPPVPPSDPDEIEESLEVVEASVNEVIEGDPNEPDGEPDEPGDH